MRLGYEKRDNMTINETQALRLNNENLFPVIEFVFCPFGDIVLNVTRNRIQFVNVSNNMVVETGLPTKPKAVFQRVRGGRRFYTSNDRGQILSLGRE